PVELRESSEDLAVIGVWGPRARDVLSSVTEDDVSGDAFPMFTARTLRVGGAKALAQRITYVGELGWELYVEPFWAVQVWDWLLGAGRSYDIRPGGYLVLDSLRIEKGYQYYGSDLTSLDNPFESGQGFCVKLDKGAFIGRDALAGGRG